VQPLINTKDNVGREVIEPLGQVIDLGVGENFTKLIGGGNLLGPKAFNQGGGVRQQPSLNLTSYRKSPYQKIIPTALSLSRK